jgi:Outer membrane protein beta-barrel domain
MKNKIYLSIYLLMLIMTSTTMLLAADGNGANGLLGDKTRLGINFNPILSWVRAPGAQTDNKGVRGGFQAGLQIDRYFATNYGFSTGIYFDYLGANINYHLPDSAGNAQPFSHQYTTQFIEVPIGLKLRTNEIKRITTYGELGLTAMVLLSARANYHNDFDGIAKEQLKVYGSRVNFFDLAAHAGAGIEYNLSGKTSIIAGVVYKYAFLNHIKDSTAKEYKGKNTGLLNDQIFLNYFAFRIGVLF